MIHPLLIMLHMSLVAQIAEQISKPGGLLRAPLFQPPDEMACINLGWVFWDMDFDRPPAGPGQ